MIIELVGLPGAGKSTFARSLSQFGKYKRITVTSTRQLLWCNVLFLLRHPVTFWRMFFLYVRYAGPYTLWYTKFMSVFLDYNAKYMLAKREPYALLDQGHMQALLSLFESVLPAEKQLRIVRLLSRSDHYIFFNIDDKVRTERLLKRGYVSRKGMSDSLREQWQKTAKLHFDFLCTNIVQLVPATVKIIDENCDLNTVVQEYQTKKYMQYITFGRMPTEKAHGLQIAKMCEAFSSMNIAVSLLTPKRTNDIAASVTDYYHLDTVIQHKEASVADVIGTVKRVRSFHHYLHELLFAWHVFFLSIPKECLIYTRSAFIAFVLGVRGYTVIAEQHFWPNRGSLLHRHMLSYARAIACNSQGTQKICLENGLTQAFVAHNGFPQEILEETIGQSEARRNLGLPVEGKIVMYIGSLGDWKGVDTLSEAADDFPEGVTAVVIGGTEKELPNWRKKYPHVNFLGAKPYEEIAQHQRAADILVVPNNPISRESCEYTSPIKLFAHMASGVPLLVSDLASLRAIVSEETADFFAAGNAVSLASGVSAILASYPVALEKASHTRSVARSYTWTERAKLISQSIS